jgi:hypothetical protein
VFLDGALDFVGEAVDMFVVHAVLQGAATMRLIPTVAITTFAAGE